MAPYTADAPRTTHSKANRPTPVASRILPAIPLVFSRPPQPPQATTPPLEAPPPALAPQAEAGKEDVHTALPHSPLTPESKASTSAVSERGSQQAAMDESASSESAAQIPSLAKETVLSPTPPGNSLAMAPEPQAIPSKPSTRIPKELPPPFYPSTENHSTPTSTTSSTAPQLNGANTAAMHHPRPSSNRIVFGGFPDSSNSSPAPPSGSMMPYPPPPPHGFYPPGYGPPPFFPPGHAPHLSDPNVGLMYPPMNMSLGNGYGHRRDQPLPSMNGRQQPWIMSEGQLHHPLRHPEPFSPRHVQTQANGTHDPYSRSASQASVRTQDKETVHASHYQVRPDGQISNGIHPAQAKQFPQDISALSLRDHVIGLFNVPEFADYAIHFVHGSSERPVLALPLHGMVASRSPVLLSSMLALRQQESGHGPKVLPVVVPKEHFNHLTALGAIKYLYGGRLLIEFGLEQGLPPFVDEMLTASEVSPAQDYMAQAVGYVAVGRALELGPVVSSGTDVIKKLLRWDTIEKALNFTLDHKTAPVQTSSSSPDEHSQARNGAFAEGYKQGLFSAIIDFITAHFPRDFVLNTLASPLNGNPLLPTVADTRPSTHHPRLSQIRFGELPAEVASSHVVTLLSSILVSLPFGVLKPLLEHHTLGARLGSDKTAEVMRSVVSERERRRQKISSSKSFPSPVPSDEPLWHNVQHEERVEPSTQHSSGFQLSRHFIRLQSPKA